MSPSFLLLASLLLLIQRSSYAAAVNSAPSATKVTPSALTINTDFFYLGAKLGGNHYQNGCELWRIECDKTDNASGLFSGYQFTPYFALEGAFLRLGDVVAVYPTGGLEQTYTGSMQGFELSIIGILPATNDFSVFTKGGLYNWYATSEGIFNRMKESGLSPTVGLGLSYQFTPSWQTRLEYQYFYELGNETIGGSRGHLTTLGLIYQFQRVKESSVVKSVYMPVELERITFAVIFDFAKSEVILTAELQQVVHRLTTYPQATVKLSGYSDDKGSKSFNLALSTKRVKQVSRYLIEQGVQATQIIEVYLGEAEPVIANDSKEHRHLNRRVQVLLPAIIVHPIQETQ